jgi:lysophospholipase L1-like esterase
MVLLATLGTAGCWLSSNNRSSLNSPPKTDKNRTMYTYLALGDSYTIGEAVPMAENFPHQTVELLKQQNIDVAAPVIVAKTGWTTDELAMAIREHNIMEQFSIVTLLIGVNNQYRGRDLENYKDEFVQLLDQAVDFAYGKREHVYVLSIPDWGVTPFAEDRNREQVAKEIDAYNKAAKEIVSHYKCHFIDITESSRHNGNNALFLAEDKLHPSGKEYAVWAAKLAPVIARSLKQAATSAEAVK